MGANGSALADYSEVLAAISALLTANAKMPTALVMAPRTLTEFAGLQATDDQPMQAPALVAGIPMLATSMIPIDDTQGTANNASCIYLGDFNELIIGIREATRIEILKERDADYGQISFIAHSRVDILPLHEGSFGKIPGVIP